MFTPIVVHGDSAEEIMADAIAPGEGMIGDLAARGAAEVINDANTDPRAVMIPGAAMNPRGAPDGRAARRPRPRDGDDGGLAHGAQ